jgi:hypothetical protein
MLEPPIHGNKKIAAGCAETVQDQTSLWKATENPEKISHRSSRMNAD